MARKAVIEGETHTSDADQQALLDSDLSSFDAVFRESHSKDYFERKLTAGYALFAVGHLLYGATYNRFYTSGDEFQEKVEEVGVPWVEMDAAVHETYGMIPLWKRVMFLAMSPVLAVLLLGIPLGVLNWVFGFFAPGIGELVLGIGVLFFFSFAWSLAYFLLVEEEAMESRDEYMAENVDRLSKTEDYDRVLVSCGDDHRKGIASYLRSRGWEVEENGTKSLLGRALGLFDRVANAVLNPIQTTRRILARL